MTTAQTASASSSADGSWLVRWSPLGGLLFVIGMVIVFVSPYSDDTGNTATEVAQYAQDKEGWILFAGIFTLLSLLLVGWFVGGLYARLRSIGAGAEGVLALIGGIGFALLYYVGLTVWNASLIGIADEKDETLRLEDAQTFLGVEDIGWFVLGGAGVGAGLMIIATSLGVLRLQSIPAWAGWVSLLLGVASFATVAFFGIFAWLVWILVASVGVLVKERP